MNFKPDEKNIRSFFIIRMSVCDSTISKRIFLGQEELSRIL